MAEKGAAGKWGEEQKALVKDEKVASAAAVKKDPQHVVDEGEKEMKKEEPAAVKAEGATKNEPVNEEVKTESLPAKPEPEEPVLTPAHDEQCSQEAAEQQHDAGDWKGSGSRKRGRDASGHPAQKEGAAAKKGKASPASAKKGKAPAKGQSSLDSFVIKNPA